MVVSKKSPLKPFKGNKKRRAGRNATTQTTNEATHVFLFFNTIFCTIVSIATKMVETWLAKLKHLWITWSPYASYVSKLELLMTSRSTLWFPDPGDLYLNRDPQAKGLVFYIGVKFQKESLYWRVPRGLSTSSPGHASIAYQHEFPSYVEYWSFIMDAKDVLAKARHVECWVQLEPSASCWRRLQSIREGTDAIQENVFFNIRPTSPGGTVLLRLQLLLSDMEHRNPANLHLSVKQW
jgi:hypothetical protein